MPFMPCVPCIMRYTLIGRNSKVFVQMEAMKVIYVHKVTVTVRVWVRARARVRVGARVRVWVGARVRVRV